MSCFVDNNYNDCTNISFGLDYKTKPIELGIQIPNTNVYGLDGTTQYDLHQLIRSKNYSRTILAVFSLS